MIYSGNGDQAYAAYAADGNAVSNAYDVAGNEVFSTDPYIQGRTLTFEDNFGGSSLDETKWGYELGYGRGTELQQYWKRCVTVENGNLVITATKLDDTGSKWSSWESGSVITFGKFSQTYGRFEAKIKFPHITGSFPAFWLLGDSLVTHYQEGERWTTESGHWPACGEVDIVEMIPGNANTAQANLWDSSTTASNPVSLGTGNSSNFDPAEWHIYACEWTDTYIAMILDGVEYKRYTFSNFSASRVSAYTGDEKMQILLDLAVGSAGGTPTSGTSEMKMYVDWVRVYAPLGT